MSVLLAAGPTAGDDDVQAVREPPRWTPEAGPTLDDVISRTWEVMRAGAPAACLVCGAELEPRRVHGSGVAGGRCPSCGTALG
jgi:hypothetical protein